MTDSELMRQALQQAQQALNLGEVPVGAVVVRHGQVIATGRNAPIGQHDPTAHAEIIALRAAAQRLGNYRLDDCELFVTLEPCAMCAGAMLHARLKRVVFGAPDPKTGAGGSVVNLFNLPQLNHHTQLQGDVLAQDCAALLQDFFKARRSQIKARSKLNHPLRDDALRTPDACFENLSDYPWPPHYLSDLPALGGLRLHYLDESPAARAQLATTETITYLCLHDSPTWSYLHRQMIPVFLASGARVVAPDLVGFGKSDKPKKEDAHSFQWHRQVLLEFIERLDLQNIVLVVRDWGDLLSLSLPLLAPTRFKDLVVTDTISIGVPLSYGWLAPFPDAGHQAAVRAFPEMNSSIESTMTPEVRAFWAERWEGA